MFDTSADFYVRLLLGHLMGDYVFQTSRMALGKSKSCKTCSVHCLVYTLSVAIWLLPEILGSWSSTVIFLLIVFASHFVIDKSPFVQILLGKIGARTFKSTLEYCTSKDNAEIEKIFYVAFTSVVHAVADNTIHFIILYLAMTILKAFI